MLAAARRDEEITAALLAAGARVQPADHAGRSALFHAAAANQAGQVRVLLAAGAALDAVDAAGGTASDAAHRHGATAAFDTLRSAGGHLARPAVARAEGIDFTRVGQLYQGWPPLLLAVARDDAAEVRRRAAAGESLAVRTPRGESTLQVAIAARAAQSVRALIELGADAHRVEDGRSLAQLVAESGDADLGRTWVELVPLTAPEAGSLLLGAVEHADAVLAQRVLARGAAPGMGAPLIRAAQLGNLEMTKLLLDRGARPDAVDDVQRSVLWHAAASRQRAIVDQLLSMHVPVDARDRHGATPLVAAIGAGDAQLVGRLLEAGAAVDGPAGGQVPLRVAAERGDTAIVAALLARRPRVDAVDGFGETALIVAARRGDEAICLALLQAGADARLRGRDRTTAADVAEARGFATLARRLRG
jgi:ankyrin repeat protein